MGHLSLLLIPVVVFQSLFLSPALFFLWLRLCLKEKVLVVITPQFSVDNQCLMDTLPFKQHNNSFINNGLTECISLPSSTLLLPVLYSNYHLSYPLKGFFALVFTSWSRGVQNVQLVPAACCVFPATGDWMLGLISSCYIAGLWQSTLSSL